MRSANIDRDRAERCRLARSTSRALATVHCRGGRSVPGDSVCLPPKFTLARVGRFFVVLPANPLAFLIEERHRVAGRN